MGSPDLPRFALFLKGAYHQETLPPWRALEPLQTASSLILQVNSLILQVNFLFSVHRLFLCYEES
ncbi:MAG: hypothetical protein ACK2T3_06870, partial [Candidatus Promineifilaceae bacterium]